MDELRMRLDRQIVLIYDAMIKLGYHKLLTGGIAEGEVLAEKERRLAVYFQCTPEREELIQWLIARISSGYYTDIDYKAQETNTKKMMSCLWKVGVMPFSKHTKHLDYQKYTQGLLGYQNAVQLIFSLCQLAIDCYQFPKSKPDAYFTPFIQQLFHHYPFLVNSNPDPYGIAWPQKYAHLDQYAFQQQFKQFQHQFSQIKNQPDTHSQHKHKHMGDKQQSGSQVIFHNLQQHRQRFMRKYDELIEKVRQIDARHKSSLDAWEGKGEGANTNPTKSIRISPQLAVKYRQYRRACQLHQYSPGQLDINKQTVRQIIYSLNQCTPE